MKSHIPDKQEQIDSVLKQVDDIIKRKTFNSFRMGAAAIANIALKDYIPEIEKAKNAKQRKDAIESLKAFFGKGDKLIDDVEVVNALRAYLDDAAQQADNTDNNESEDK